MAFKRREGLAGGGITRYVDNNMPIVASNPATAALKLWLKLDKKVD